MLHPGPLTVDGGALAISVDGGVSSALDAAAGAADPAHGFLRSAWYAAAGSEGATTLVARRSGSGEILAALPLALRRVGPLALREVAGCYWPLRSFPIADDCTDDELVAFLASAEARSGLGRAWRLGPVPEDDPTALRLKVAARRSGWTILSRRIATCYRLDLPSLTASGAWPSSSRGQTLRRRERRLARIGEVTATVVTGAAWNGGVLDTLAAIEAESWVARDAGVNDAKFLAGSPCRAVWDQAIADPALAGRLVCWILSVGNTPAAFVFCLDAGGTRHVVANGYSERFAEGSPGQILLFRCFTESADAGVETICWGAGDAGYKCQMGAEPGPEIVDLLIVRGRALAVLAGPLWRRGG